MCERSVRIYYQESRKPRDLAERLDKANFLEKPLKVCLTSYTMATI